MEVASDPYMNPRMGRRFGMPYGMPSTNAAEQDPFRVSARSPLRQRLPILPDQSSRPSVSPAGSGSSSGLTPGAIEAAQQQQEKQQAMGQRATQLNNQNVRERDAQAMRDQATSIAAYRNSPGHLADVNGSREQSQEASALGIDKSSSPTDIAAASNGPVHFDEQGLPTGGTAGGVSPTQPNDVRDAVLQIQATKDGQQRVATDQAYANGIGQRTPFSPVTATPALRSAPLQLSNGTTASAPAPSPNPAQAPIPPTPFSPVIKPRKNYTMNQFAGTTS